MKIGLVLPQTEIGDDPAVIRDYAQTAEGLGYTHILAYDHIVGADVTNRPNWQGAYQLKDQFHEPFVLFSYFAAFTTRLELVTGVIILPQRQTVLLAKQAAALDVLSGGRLRLGVGVGWNEVEYVALNENFKNRGRREEEQIEVMRLLWTQPSVTFEGRWHHLPGVGINPLPVQRPIPVWLGGRSEPAYQRIARIADGWMPQFRPDAQGVAIVEHVRELTRAAGRDPSQLGMESRLSLAQMPREQWRADLERWRELGADYLSINTMGLGLSPREHIATVERVYQELGVAEFNRG
ncbi:MAG TPA: LLM class F420-dependent oxidoreductase [Thermomicrobiaceae bacterium]|nr:LLM class F420-dependent oxidoreductase [Thermomicrobiaceae bacterium]